MAIVPLILTGRPAELWYDQPHGLCGNKQDHEPHVYHSGSLGTFWCHADQVKRLPFAAERRRQNNGVA